MEAIGPTQLQDKMLAKFRSQGEAERGGEGV